MAWTDDLDNEGRAYVANKGWDRLEPDKAAQAITQSYRNLERSRPEPPPKEYTFEGVPPEVATRAREIATELKLPAAAATTLATRLAKEASDAATAATTEAANRNTAAETALKTAWGTDYDKNFDAAGKALEATGRTKEEIQSLVSVLGADKVMQMGYDLSTKMGEAAILRGDTNLNSTNQTALTRETALQERNKMFADKAWFDKWQTGDAEAVERFNKVTSAILGDPNGQWSAPPENFGRQGDGHGTEVLPGSAKWKG